MVLYVFLGRGDSEVGPKRSYEPNVSDPDIFYAIVFDAGSTGSRIHVNKFTKRTGKLELLYELFEQVKPGLSSFADDVSGEFKFFFYQNFYDEIQFRGCWNN